MGLLDSIFQAPQKLFGKNGGGSEGGARGGDPKPMGDYVPAAGGGIDVAATTRNMSSHAGAQEGMQGGAISDAGDALKEGMAHSKDVAGAAGMGGLGGGALAMGGKGALAKLSASQNGGAIQAGAAQPPVGIGTAADDQAMGGMGDMMPSINSDKHEKNMDGLADRAVEQFLNKLDPKLYTYKDPSFAPTPKDFDKPQLGILAQDVEKTSVGKSLIDKDPMTGLLKVKVMPMGSALAASVAHLNKKLDAKG